MTTGWQTCAIHACTRPVYAHQPWYPYCSNEHEQLAWARQRLDEARQRPSATTQATAPAVQLDIESALPWEPRRFDVGTLERVLTDHFEAHSATPTARERLMEIGRRALGRGVNQRNVMDAIRELRRGGWPIISSSGEKGYWISWDPADLDTLEQTLRGRSLDMLKTWAAVRRARSRRGRVPLDIIIEQIEQEISDAATD